MSRRFAIRWVPLSAAAKFVAKHHRPHDPTQGGIVAIGLWEGEQLVGVSVIGRPVSRELQRQGVVEVTRNCVLPDLKPSGQHASGAASMLYSRARRLASDLGFAKIVTYTLPDEKGASLKGDGWQCDLELVGGGEATRPSRKRAAASWPTTKKKRWWGSVRAQAEIEIP